MLGKQGDFVEHQVLSRLCSMQDAFYVLRYLLEHSVFNCIRTRDANSVVKFSSHYRYFFLSMDQLATCKWNANASGLIVRHTVSFSFCFKHPHSELSKVSAEHAVRIVFVVSEPLLLILELTLSRDAVYLLCGNYCIYAVDILDKSKKFCGVLAFLVIKLGKLQCQTCNKMSLGHISMPSLPKHQLRAYTIVWYGKKTIQYQLAVKWHGS